MNGKSTKTRLTLWQSIKSFFVPRNFGRKVYDDEVVQKQVAILIPTYRPSIATSKLVRDLFQWNKHIVKIVVVDDCSPVVPEIVDVLNDLHQLSQDESRLVVLRTPENKLKAGALNYGIEYLNYESIHPEVVVTFDDDVEIDQNTIREMLKALYADESIGAVCSSVRIVNKNKNLLTRLQGLEYHSFNITKTSDIGFVQGPLVMQGMLTAFKYEALKEVGGFPTGYLIEDYHITAGMKTLGWQVGMAPKAVGWTDVPESFPVLWRQRIRWTYGGLAVVRDFKHYLPAIIQDLLGHLLFLITWVLIAVSLIMPIDHSNSSLLLVLLTVAILQFLIGFVFQIITLRSYRDADWVDWLIRLSVIPEFFYSNALSLVLIGSYVFYAYNQTVRPILVRLPLGLHLYRYGLAIFSTIGFSEKWGTR